MLLRPDGLNLVDSQWLKCIESDMHNMKSLLIYKQGSRWSLFVHNMFIPSVQPCCPHFHISAMFMTLKNEE